MQRHSTLKQPSFFSESLLLDALELKSQTVRPERLPTNTTAGGHPVHRWFNFIAGFSPEFVDLACRALPGERSKDVLLDPFAGCGTAPIVAATRGMVAVGYEAHPVFEKICRAKLPGTDALCNLDLIEDIVTFGLTRKKAPEILGVAQVAFLSKLFPLNVLSQLLGARQELLNRNLSDDPLAFLVLSRLLELSSHSATDGIYKAPDTKKRALEPAEALRGICDTIRTDLQYMAGVDFASRVRIFGKSSEAMDEIEDRSVSLVVTSPPYLNNFDYAEMTRMHLYFWGLATTWGEITDKVRSRLIVNTTTALKGHKQLQDKYREELPARVRPGLDEIVSTLREQRKIRAGKKEYQFIIYPYFAQMTSVLRECHRALKLGAPIHIVVADAALYGVHIDTHEYLCELLSALGFRDVGCTLMRKRGHRWVLSKREGSKKGLGEYHIHAKR